MNAKKRIVVNYASKGREDYIVGSQRLLDCMNLAGVDADLLICSPDSLSESMDLDIYGRKVYFRKRMPLSKNYGECPPHTNFPYAFKSFIIQEAREMGYEKILWADCSCVFLKNVETYWNLADEIGVVLVDNPGCPEAVWTADDCLEHMGCDQEFAKTFFEIDAFMMLLNFSSPATNPCLGGDVQLKEETLTEVFFKNYLSHSMDGVCLKGARGSKRPEFKAHRHDQSIASYYAKILNIHPLNYGAWCYAYEVGIKFSPTFVKAGVSQNFNWQLAIDMNKEGKNILGTSFVA